ncbi:hypothetical protein NAT51_12595 [Flavobacterium amniphilum]|uniref:hypothetical protein n=1 Tax=Flavobacterium amniphilum TaxID=1834035 RepID=UPI002029E7BE|nr:hypothetical protein [Flavobacterium amniphilum]MCL9805780.1 hypothetical protein [Flavobacterium amniphilum]MCL9806367.1 hypothetical protein [Flavobacterium amniphilum]
MKTDLYTKTVLTIIAVCLTVLTLQSIDIVPKSYASGNEKTAITTAPKNYGLVPVNEDGSIDVTITRISTTDELDVNIDEIGGGFLSHGGPVPVTIKQQ